MKKITLDTRLKVLTSLAEPGKITADIGTDHGYLIGWLVQNGLIPKGYATDINPGPLKRAEDNLSAAELLDSIQLILTPGLQGLEDKGIQQIILAGMGGELIGQILADSPWAHQEDLVFLLLPMTRDHLLRSQLYQLGFEITQEQATQKGSFIYSCMKARYTGVCQQISLHFAWAGLHWEDSSPLSIRYLQRRLELLEKRSPKFRLGDGYQQLVTTWTERLEPQ